MGGRLLVLQYRMWWSEERQGMGGAPKWTMSRIQVIDFSLVKAIWVCEFLFDRAGQWKPICLIFIKVAGGRRLAFIHILCVAVWVEKWLCGWRMWLYLWWSLVVRPREEVTYYYYYIYKKVEHIFFPVSNGRRIIVQRTRRRSTTGQNCLVTCISKKKKKLNALQAIEKLK